MIRIVGVAIVASILLRFKKGFSYDDLFKKLNTFSKRGTISTRIVEHLNDQNIVAQRIENSNMNVLKEMVSSEKICIVMYQNWDTGEENDPNLVYGHYAFVLEIDDEGILLADPSINIDLGFGVGKYKYTLDDFQRRWVDKENGKIIERGLIVVDE